MKTPVILKNTMGEWFVSLFISVAGMFACMGVLTLRGRPLSLYSFNKASALTAVWLVLAVIALGTLCRTTQLSKPLRYRRTFGILASLLICVHVALSLFSFPDRYDWNYYASKSDALLYGLAATIGFLLLWLTSYEVFFRRMRRAPWKRLHNGIYILLALAVLHVSKLGKPLCWLDWLEGSQACSRFGYVPPLSFVLFVSLLLVSVLRLLEPLAWKQKWGNNTSDQED